MLLLILVIAFLVDCRPAAPGNRNDFPTIASREDNEEVADNCNLTYTTYSSISNPVHPSWMGRIIIVCPVIIGTNPVVDKLGFLVESAFANGDGFVDLLVYNATQSGSPGTLLYKVNHVDINSFASGEISCVPFSATFAIGQKVFLGFWTYSGSATKCIAYQGHSNSEYWYNIQGVNSPVVGSIFPSPQLYTAAQILMGFGASMNTCSGLPCGSCTQNSGCVWCLNSQTCISPSGIPQCPSWTRNPAFCNACPQYMTCQTCASVANQCSWCETNGKSSVCVSTPSDGNCTTAITNPGFCNE